MFIICGYLIKGLNLILLLLVSDYSVLLKFSASPISDKGLLLTCQTTPDQPQPPPPPFIVLDFHYKHASLLRKACVFVCSQGDNKQFDLPLTKKNDICTIMYTSGTTGDPKGVMISNDSIVTLIAGVKRLLQSVNEEVIFSHFKLSPHVINGIWGEKDHWKFNLCFFIVSRYKCWLFNYFILF